MPEENWPSNLKTIILQFSRELTTKLMQRECNCAEELYSMLKRHQNHVRVDLDTLLVQIKDDPLNLFASYKSYMRR